MLRLIIISDDNNYVTEYKELLAKSLMDTDLFYKYYEFNDNNKMLDRFLDIGYKFNIFIIKESNKVRSAEIVDKIRNQYNDPSSFIIINNFENKVNQHNNINNVDLHVDVISDKRNHKELINATIKNIIRIFNCMDKQISFVYDGFIYKIPYSDILYIEKEPGCRLCTIVTKKDIFSINKSLTEVKKMLNGSFYQTHRSAIINKENVKYLELKSNKIFFYGNVEFYLISRLNRRGLREELTKQA